MTGLPEVIGLLYRADWTRLSLSAEFALRDRPGAAPAPVARGSVSLVPRLAGAEARQRPLRRGRSAAGRSRRPVAPGVPGSRPGRRGRGRRGGEPRDLGATARQWLDVFAMAAPVPEGFRAAGRGGLGDLLDAMTRGTNVARTEARLRVSGPDRYRLDFSRRPRRIDSMTIACDGERRWTVFQDRILVGPAAPAGSHRVPGRLVLAAPPPAIRRRGAHLPWPARPPAPRHSRPRRRGGGPGAADDVHHRRDRGRPHRRDRGR